MSLSLNMFPEAMNAKAPHNRGAFVMSKRENIMEEKVHMRRPLIKGGQSSL